MSMTIDVKIKGELIHHIRVSNKGPIIPAEGKHTHKYDYISVKMKTGDVIKGKVKHNRRSGAKILLVAILKDMDKFECDI